MLQRISVLIIIFLFCSCDSNGVFDEYKSTPNIWHKDQSINFKIEVPDTINAYNLFINFRNNGEYPFNNLYLITEMNFPNHSKVTDTLEYEMAEANGEWLGQGFSDVKESKLWYKENVRFPIMGTCEIKISHAMRENGSVLGVETLDGVTDVGFRIEKIK